MMVQADEEDVRLVADRARAERVDAAMSARPVAVVLGARGRWARALDAGLPAAGWRVAAAVGARRVRHHRRRRRCARCSGRARPTVVFNAAAYTDVDRAESEPDRAHAVNATGAENVARGGRRVGRGRRPLFDRLRLRRRAARGPTTSAIRRRRRAATRASKVAGDARWSRRPTRATSSCASAACTGTAGATSRRRSCAACAPARPSAPTAIASARRPGCARSPPCRRRWRARRTTASTTAPRRARPPGPTSPALAAELLGVPGRPRRRASPTAELPLKAPRPRRAILDNRALRALGLDTLSPWQDALRAFLAAEDGAQGRARTAGEAR